MIGYLLAFTRVIGDIFLITSRKKLRYSFNSSFLLMIQSSLSLFAGLLGFLLLDPVLNNSVILYACLSVFLVSLANLMSIYAFKFDEFSKLAPLSGGAVIFALILGVIFLNQIPSTLQYLGIGIAVIGIYLLGNNGKWSYPLSFFKQKPVMIYLFAGFWGVFSKVFMDKSFHLAAVKDVAVYNLLFSFPIVFLMYLIVTKAKFPVLIEKGSKPQNTVWFIPMFITESAAVVLNVVTIYFLDIVIAELIFSLNILASLVAAKIFFGETVYYKIFPTFLIFLGVVLSILG